MTDVQPLGPTNVQEAIDRLLDKGCKTVIITLGEMGAAYASKENRIAKLIPVTPVQPVDTTVSLKILNVQGEPHNVQELFLKQLRN